MPTRSIENWKSKKNEISKSFQKIAIKLSRQNSKKLDIKANEMHELVFRDIDCLKCANCCKSIPPIVNETDIKRISKYLGIKANDFKQSYLKYDEDMDLVINHSPCPFLESDNKCRIYDYRPKACREYPHTNDFEFSKNIKLHAINS